MFIKVRRNNCPVLLPLDQIALVEPFDGGQKVVIKSVSGMTYFWDCSLDQAQDALIDNAAQVTAPIASRVLGMDNTIARLCRSLEDVLEKFNTPIIGPYSPEEEAEIRRTLEGTRRTLDSITTPAPRQQIGIESDVLAIIQLLKDREWAEHCTTTELGGDLEAEITALVGTENATAGRLKKAEALLKVIAEDSRRWPDLYERIDSKLIQSVHTFADSTNC